uniref:Uncharacterized protein n=1 Tax=Cacopsylla melanoneura TaxID=428564 RepID=A0A8D9FK40_9HEMI
MHITFSLIPREICNDVSVLRRRSLNKWNNARPLSGSTAHNIYNDNESYVKFHAQNVWLEQSKDVRFDTKREKTRTRRERRADKKQRENEIIHQKDENNSDTDDTDVDTEPLENLISPSL